MRKKLPKILTILFIVVFILQLTALLFLLVSPAAAVEFTPQIGIGNDFQAGVAKTVGNDTIAIYIRAIYQYGIGVVGILAAIVLMFGGLLWLTAGGNTGQVTEAKEWIKASLTGLIIALLSYVILLTINPDLVDFRPITVEPIKSTGSENSTDTSNQDTGQKILEKTENVVSINIDCNDYYKDKIAQYMELAKNSGRKITVKVSKYDPGDLLNGSSVDETGFKTAPTKKNCVFVAVEDAAK